MLTNANIQTLVSKSSFDVFSCLMGPSRCIQSKASLLGDAGLPCLNIVSSRFSPQYKVAVVIIILPQPMAPHNHAPPYTP